MIDARFRPVIEFLEEYRLQDYFPGAAVSISEKSHILLEAGIGRLEPLDSAPEVQTKTLFDLASLTKPIAVSTAVLMLMEKQLLAFHDPIAMYLPEFKHTDKQDLTVFQLLTHTSGLPAWRPLYIAGHGISLMMQALIETPLETTPGSTVCYSCLGFIILAEIVRRITGSTLSEFCNRTIFLPLQMIDTCFNPLPALRFRIAPTEMGNTYERSMAGLCADRYHGWRSHRLQGEVHDGNSHALYGEGGNAGLFSTVRDVMQFGQWMLNWGTFGQMQLLDAETIRLAITDYTPWSDYHRGLGWQIAHSAYSAGNRLSANAFGHTGFTGTSLWIDPEKQLTVVLLTNRVFFGGDGSRFGAIRGPFHDLIIDCCTK